MLLLHDPESHLVSTEGIRWLADQLPRATYREVRRDAGRVSLMPYRAAAEEVSEFLTGNRAHGDERREVATLLVTDVVGSTGIAARSGDAAWKHLLGAHREVVRRELGRFAGREVDTAGDGFLAAFVLPSAALRCARGILTGTAALGIEARAGVHTGEVIVQDASYVGLAVHVASRVAALACPSEVLLTEAVKALVAGTGIAVEPAGEHTLRGVPDRWTLHRLVGTGSPTDRLGE